MTSNSPAAGNAASLWDAYVNAEVTHDFAALPEAVVRRLDDAERMVREKFGISAAYYVMANEAPGHSAKLGDIIAAVMLHETEAAERERQQERARRLMSATFACRSEDCPQPFALHRHQDVTGVSGSGTVAHGVQFADGTVVIRWLGDRASTVVWDSLATAMKVHGHDGKTQVVWLAAPFSEMGVAEQEAAAAEREHIISLASQLRASFPADHPKGAQASFADYLRVTSADRLREDRNV